MRSSARVEWHEARERTDLFDRSRVGIGGSSRSDGRRLVLPYRTKDTPAGAGDGWVAVIDRQEHRHRAVAIVHRELVRPQIDYLRCPSSSSFRRSSRAPTELLQRAARTQVQPPTSRPGSMHFLSPQASLPTSPPSALHCSPIVHGA
jgi:hypothetical protein